MTCIAALVDKNGDIYMGGDSAGVSIYQMNITSNKKVFINNNFIIGYTSSFRMGQLLEYSFSPPELFEGEDIMKYMVTKFIPTVRQVFKNGGYTMTENGVEVGGFFLVGFRSRLFCVESDFQVFETAKRYCATGCGEREALSSFYNTEHIEDPELRVKRALETAVEFNAAVSEPLYVLKLENKQK